MEKLLFSPLQLLHMFNVCYTLIYNPFPQNETWTHTISFPCHLQDACMTKQTSLGAAWNWWKWSALCIHWHKLVLTSWLCKVEGEYRSEAKHYALHSANIMHSNRPQTKQLCLAAISFDLYKVLRNKIRDAIKCSCSVLSHCGSHVCCS